MAKLMCLRHWRRLPCQIQLDVTETWKRLDMDGWKAAGRRARAWLDAHPEPVIHAPRWSGIDLSHPEATRP